METKDKLSQYYQKEHHFKKGIAALRDLAKKTEATESYKWNFPVYTIADKNVFGICRFKNHFGIWFFNGAFLSDPKKILENAQEGKTKAMRHWKFTSNDHIDEEGILAYLTEAIENQKKGIELKISKKDPAISLPTLLEEALEKYPEAKKKFESFSNYKQREFCGYVENAKQKATKLKRIEKIIPLIQHGIGLNDTYRKKSTS